MIFKSKQTRLIFFVLLFSFITHHSCRQFNDASEEFEEYVNNFQEAHVSHFSNRDEMKDSLFTATSQLKQDSIFYNHWYIELERIDTMSLSNRLQNSQKNIRVHLNKKIAALEAIKKNPATYNLISELDDILFRDEISLENRLTTIGRVLNHSIEFYHSAKSNVTTPQPEQIERAIQEHILSYEFLRTTLPNSIEKATWTEKHKESFLQSIERTKLEIKDYLAFCRSLQFEYRNKLHK